MVACYLIEQGHRRFGFVGDDQVPDDAIHTSERRLTGYRQSRLGHSIDLPAEYIALGRHGMESARQLAHHLLDLREPPTAIFTPSDTQALAVLKAARERGLATILFK
jgi:DNA-binding LacI/PurR family transcriptional regulator